MTALPTPSARLGATTDQLQWISAACTLALAGFMIPAGVLADRLGRRRTLLAALVVFGASSVVASQMTAADGLISMCQSITSGLIQGRAIPAVSSRSSTGWKAG